MGELKQEIVDGAAATIHVLVSAGTIYPANVAAFVAPGWILVARDGSHKAWSSNLVNSNTNSISVVGRYAMALR